MAAASMVFRDANPHYSHLLLKHAHQLFEFSDKYRGKYDDSIGVTKNYYASLSGYEDELLRATLWLYKASNKVDYLKYVIKNAHSFGGTGWAVTEFSWDMKYTGVQIIASKLLMDGKNKGFGQILEQYWRLKAHHYVCACLNKHEAGHVRWTPGGLMYIREWNNMQYVSTAAFLFTVYSRLSTKFWARCGVPWRKSGSRRNPQICKVTGGLHFGCSPMGMSYLVGFGFKFPKRVHHRGASMVSYRQ